MKNQKPFWRIQCYDRSKEIFCRDLEAHHLGENQAKALARTLAARALSLDEIVDSCVARNAPNRRELLEVHRNGPNLSFWCGGSPIVTVTFVRPNDRAAKVKE